MKILVTRFAFETRLSDEKRIDATKNAHGTERTATLTMSARRNGTPDNDANAYFTSTPAHTTSVGIRIAHMKPINDCLYFTLISRQASMYNRSRRANISRNQLPSPAACKSAPAR